MLLDGRDTAPSRGGQRLVGDQSSVAGSVDDGFDVGGEGDREGRGPGRERFERLVRHLVTAAGHRRRYGS